MQWQLLDRRDKLVASREQPGHCWPCAQCNISWRGIISLCFVNLGCTSRLLILSHYLATVETTRSYLYQAPVSAWRALDHWHWWDEPPLVTRANEDAQGCDVSRLWWCDEAGLECVSGHPIMVWPGVEMSRDTGDICDTIPPSWPGHEPWWLCGNKFQFLCNPSSRAIFVSGVKSYFSLFPVEMGGWARASTIIIMDLNTFRQQLCIPGW